MLHNFLNSQGIFLVLVLLSFILFSCDKNPNPGNNQDIELLTEEECEANNDYHLGFIHQNTTWCADFEIISDMRNRLYIRAESQNGLFVEAFLTDYVNGNYPLDGERNQIIINRFGNVFQSYNDITGNIDILEYSPGQQSIIGANFTFTAINYQSGEQQFISGSFRVAAF
ncbi:MAG: hypothetical protein WD334_08185 [Chitinophagales bacterium]